MVGDGKERDSVCKRGSKKYSEYNVRECVERAKVVRNKKKCGGIKYGLKRRQIERK